MTAPRSGSTRADATPPDGARAAPRGRADRTGSTDPADFSDRTDRVDFSGRVRARDGVGTRDEWRFARGDWALGVTAGVVGGLAFGVVLSALASPVIATAVPALVGLSGGLAGWVVHVAISAAFGVVFAGLLTRTRLAADVTSYAGAVKAGVAYGALLWLVAAGFVMPAWLSAVGFADAPAIPDWRLASLAGHLAYGAALGATFHYLDVERGVDRPESAPGRTRAS